MGKVDVYIGATCNGLGGSPRGFDIIVAVAVACTRLINLSVHRRSIIGRFVSHERSAVAAHEKLTIIHILRSPLSSCIRPVIPPDERALPLIDRSLSRAGRAPPAAPSTRPPSLWLPARPPARPSALKDGKYILAVCRLRRTESRRLTSVNGAGFQQRRRPMA